MSFARGFLQEREIVIGEWTALTVPIHYESRDAQAARLLNLPAKEHRILAGIAYVFVAVVTEPRHVDGEQFWGR